LNIPKWDDNVNTNFSFEGEYGYEPESIEALRFDSGKERRTPRNGWTPKEFPSISLMLDNSETLVGRFTELALFKWWYKEVLMQGSLPFEMPTLGGQGRSVYKFVLDSLRFDGFGSTVEATFGLIEVGDWESMPDPLREWVLGLIVAEREKWRQGDADTLDAARGHADDRAVDTLEAAKGYVADREGIVDPLMDGAAEVGGSSRFAREDHRHPVTPPQGPLAGTDTTVDADGRTVNAANQRPLPGAGIGVEDRTVSIPDGGVTDAMLGNRTVQNPAVGTGTHSRDLTQIANDAAGAIRLLRTHLEAFQELTETEIMQHVGELLTPQNIALLLVGVTIQLVAVAIRGASWT